MTAQLQVDFTKRYEQGPVISVQFSMPIAHFHVLALFGPSGCGKTTVLRVLAGLESAACGYIHWDSETWLEVSKSTHLTPQERRVGYLAQDYALFPHLNVEQNIGYGLRRWPQQERHERVQSLVTLMGLTGLEKRYPKQLSGGQQQRVALARALAPQPRLLLLDEPLSAVDAPTRAALRNDLRKWLSTVGIPTVIVTHDRADVLALGDTVAVMNAGCVYQVGPVDVVFSQPSHPQVAEIVGIETVVPGEVIHLQDELAEVRVADVTLWATAGAISPGPVFVVIPADQVLLVLPANVPGSARNRLTGRVTHIIRDGALMKIHLDCSFPLTATVTRQAYEELAIQVGQSLVALIKASAVHLIRR